MSVDFSDKQKGDASGEHNTTVLAFSKNLGPRERAVKPDSHSPLPVLMFHLTASDELWEICGQGHMTTVFMISPLSTCHS